MFLVTTALTETPQALAPSPRRAPAHCPALDGLRGMAILAVMFYHFSGGYKGTNPLLRAWSGMVGAGWMGVDLFFVLSGFLITGILYDTALAENRTKNFYARRALRIFPLFYGILFLLLILTPVLHLHWQAAHALYFVYLGNITGLVAPNLAPIRANVGLGHLWSLAVEEQFYMLWPFVVWNVHNRRRLLQIITLVLVLAPVLRLLLLYKGMNVVSIGYLLFTRADSLLIGGAVALLVRGPAWDSLPATTVFWVSLACLALVLVASGGPQEGPWMTTIGYTSIAVCSACLVYMAQAGETVVNRIFSAGFLRFFGRYSYGLYVYHGLFFVYLRSKAGSLQGYVHSSLQAQFLMVLLGFGVSLGLAMLSFHFFEAPILKLKARFA